MDCFSCVHFYVTWDQNYPRGCREYNFKTPYLPSVKVQQAIGRPCPGYVKKENKTNRE